MKMKQVTRDFWKVSKNWQTLGVRQGISTQKIDWRKEKSCCYKNDFVGGDAKYQ